MSSRIAAHTHTHAPMLFLHIDHRWLSQVYFNAIILYYLPGFVLLPVIARSNLPFPIAFVQNTTVPLSSNDGFITKTNWHLFFSIFWLHQANHSWLPVCVRVNFGSSFCWICLAGYAARNYHQATCSFFFWLFFLRLNHVINAPICLIYQHVRAHLRTCLTCLYYDWPLPIWLNTEPSCQTDWPVHNQRLKTDRTSPLTWTNQPILELV